MTDDYSRFRKAYFLRDETEVVDRIRDFLKWFQLKTGKWVYHLHSDGVSEFKNRKLQSLLRSTGCDFSYSPPYTPQLNSIAERLNRSLLDLARTLIVDSGLGKKAWAEAICFATHMVNVTKYIEREDKTPFEIVTGHKPYFGRIRRFGTRCWFYNIQPNKDKLDERAIAGAIVGIDEDGLSYRVLASVSMKSLTKLC